MRVHAVNLQRPTLRRLTARPIAGTGGGPGVPAVTQLVTPTSGEPGKLSGEESPMPVTRRRFLTGSTLAAAALPLADLVRPRSPMRRRPPARAAASSATGWPAATREADRVILWTRVSGATAEVPVRWVLAATRRSPRWWRAARRRPGRPATSP